MPCRCPCKEQVSSEGKSGQSLTLAMFLGTDTVLEAAPARPVLGDLVKCLLSQGPKQTVPQEDRLAYQDSARCVSVAAGAERWLQRHGVDPYWSMPGGGGWLAS